MPFSESYLGPITNNKLSINLFPKAMENINRFFVGDFPAQDAEVG